MTAAPEPYLTACLEVLHQATIAARAWGWSGDVPAEHLADLMDAVHNIPRLVHDWGRCDVPFLRESFLMAYQRKWAGRGGLALCDIFDQAVARAGKPVDPGAAPDCREGHDS